MPRPYFLVFLVPIILYPLGNPRTSLVLALLIPDQIRYSTSYCCSLMRSPALGGCYFCPFAGMVAEICSVTVSLLCIWSIFTSLFLQYDCLQCGSFSRPHSWLLGLNSVPRVPCAGVPASNADCPGRTARNHEIIELWSRGENVVVQGKVKRKLEFRIAPVEHHLM